MNQTVALRPIITDRDLAISATVYADSRAEEMAPSGWPQDQINAFLMQQFEFQHKHYTRHYIGAAFNLITVDSQDVGRLYVHRTQKEIRIMDIAVLRSWRQKGIGGYLLKQLIDESEEDSILMSLHVERENPILPYYERLGFVKGELRGVYYYMEREPHVLIEK